MKILLEELPHQNEALQAIDKAFYGIDEQAIDPDKDYIYANPLVKGRGLESTNIDIKMETGTGKTYVGVRTMYELHQKYGLFKFIIVVPSPAIKEGWKNFIEADYAKQHFSQYYENVSINLNVINNGDFKTKSGRKNMPASLLDFIEGNRLNTNTIEVLLINAQMLNSSSMKKEYDQTLLSGLTQPVAALQAVRPIVLIDEPHRFPRDKANYAAIENTQPQMLIRFGATFPDVKVGKGKAAKIIKDYYRKEPQYNLNAVRSFNEGLVKGIDVYYPNVTEEQAKDQYVVDSVTAKQLVLKHGTTKHTINVGDDIGFDGSVTYEGSKTLSNGLELEKGMVFLPATMTNFYQEMIIRDAIDKHFETEWANFRRENDHQAKVKTLSLFFIDSIASYRDEHGWLKDIFEKLLQRKVEALIREFELKKLPREQEYLSFLRATLANLRTDVHAGYFGQDNLSGEEQIKRQVDDILRNKEKLLSFKDAQGNWLTRRFLFSKWTLREGWDNPNVFVIAKLRTSGSENSKIQEVGRGLRLPVDENGHRILQGEMPSRLKFFIGYDEREFANKLIGEVNSDTEVVLNTEMLDDETVKIILRAHPELTEETLKEQLGEAGIISFSGKYKEGGFEKIKAMYPEITETQIRPGVITTGGPTEKLRVKLRKDNWYKMRDLWETFANRYMLTFERIPVDAMKLLVDTIMQNKSNFMLQYPETIKSELYYNDEEDGMRLREQTVMYDNRKPLSGMRYGDFLQKLAQLTKIKVSLLHSSLVTVLKTQYNGDTRLLNELTLSNLNRDFKQRFEEKYAQSYDYQPLAFQASTSIFDTQTNDFKDDVLANVIGVNEDKDVIDDGRQLYELPPLRFDSSNPEKELLKRGYEAKVTAFGKLPRKAIQIPKYMGGTTTPDFVYVVEKEDNTHVYLLVETKAEGSGKRFSDAQIIEIQQRFFGELQEKSVVYTQAETAQDVYSKLKEIENEQ